MTTSRRVTLDQALAEFHRAGGSRYQPRGALAGGEVGATDAVDNDGRRVVAKWEWPAGRDTLDQLQQAASLVEHLRSRGARVPRYLVVDQVKDGVLVIQERMPGIAGDKVPASLIDDLLAHNSMQSDVGTGGGGWKAYVCRSLLSGLDGYANTLPCGPTAPRPGTYSREPRLQGLRWFTASLSSTTPSISTFITATFSQPTGG
jgi:hypothetical protein